MSSIMPKPVDSVNQVGEAREDGVLERVHAVMHAYRARQYQVLRDGPHEVTHMESKVLGFFARRPGATQSDVAQHSGRDKAQLARLVAGLRERGLLAAQTDEADRRAVRLSPTAAGKAVQQALQAQARRLNARATAGMSAAEVEELKALLARLLVNLDAAG